MIVGLTGGQAWLMPMITTLLEGAPNKITRRLMRKMNGKQ
jgi:hypothetical protein